VAFPRIGGRYTPLYRTTHRESPSLGAYLGANRRKARMAVPITPVKLGDVVKLKKPHPCGTNEWEIVRVGADIGLKCRGCDRRVILVRSEFDRRFRGFIERASADTSEPLAPPLEGADSVTRDAAAGGAHEGEPPISAG